jgi:hypothetical protein
VQKHDCKYIIQIGDPRGHTQTALLSKEADGKSASSWFDLFYGYRNRTAAMSVTEIEEEIHAFGEAARRVREIGCDVAGAPCSVSYSPEVSLPILFPQLRELFLEAARGSSLEPLNQIAQRFRRRILDQHVDMVTTDHSFEYFDILGVTDLDYQLPASGLDVSFEHVIAVLGNPDQSAVNLLILWLLYLCSVI